MDESTNYTVNLTATNAGGSDSTAFTNNVVSNALEAVHFEYDPYLYGDADNEGTQVPTTYGSPTYNAAGYYSASMEQMMRSTTTTTTVSMMLRERLRHLLIGITLKMVLYFSFGRDNASTTYRGQIILKVIRQHNSRFVLRKGSSSADQIQFAIGTFREQVANTIL